MRITSENYDFYIDDVPYAEDDWIIIQTQSVTYDKHEFFVEEFEKQFVEYTLLGSNNFEKFTFLSELCGRTEAMRKWFAATSVQYSNTTQLPLYLKDCVAPDKYKEVLDKLLILKDKLAEVTQERNDAAAEYQAKIQGFNAKERSIVKKTIGDDNILKIVSLTTESLPLSIQMKIQSYQANSPDADLADGRRRLAQEYLARFKRALIELNEREPIKDIDALLDEITLK